MLLLEPLNYRRGRPSWLGALAAGDASLLLALLASRRDLRRAVGVLELLGADAVDLHGAVPRRRSKIFEMPVLGYLGFPPFALECYAMYHWLRGWLGRRAPRPGGAIIRRTP